MAKCKGKLRRTGKPCKRTANKGREFCHLHGGETLAGADHPNFKHGLYSRFVPKTLAESYAEMSQAGAKILDVREQVKVLQVLLSRALEENDIESLPLLAERVSQTIERHFRVLDLAAKHGDAPDLDLSRLDDDDLNTFERLYRLAAGL